MALRAGTARVVDHGLYAWTAVNVDDGIAAAVVVKAQAVVAAQGERRHGRRGVFGGGSDGSGVDAGAVAGGGALAHEAGGAALEANRLDKGGVRLGHGIEQLGAGGGLGGGGALGHELADGVLAAADGPARGAEGADGAVAGGVGRDDCNATVRKDRPTSFEILEYDVLPIDLDTLAVK